MAGSQRFRGIVRDSGGGEVQIVVDRNTPRYPAPGQHVEVRYAEERKRGASDPSEPATRLTGPNGGLGNDRPAVHPRPELDLLRFTAEGGASRGDDFSARILGLLDYTESLETALATLAVLSERLGERIAAVEKELLNARQVTGLVGEHN